jgi:hypothetical protein
MVTDFDVMFVSKNTSLEYQFSNQMAALQSYGGKLSYPVVRDLDSEFEPMSYGQQRSFGV